MELEGARVLVTGGGGFLGKRIVDVLRRRGADPIAVRSASYDLTQPDDVRRCLADARPDAIVHAAAVVGGIGANRAHPGRFFYANATMGILLIHEAWRAGIAKMTVVGTVCSYPKLTPVPFAEDDIWNGYPEETNAPYGLAKKMLLVQAQAYRAEYGFNCSYVIPTNLYGPEDNFDPETGHVIPAILLKCIEAKAAGTDRIVLWGTGAPTREFLYVDDAARGIVAALERYDAPEPVNLGAGREIAIRDLAALIAELVGYEGAIEWDAAQPDGQPRRAVDGSRARDLLGWSPEVDLRDGLERTVRWYEAARAASAGEGSYRPGP